MINSVQIEKYNYMLSKIAAPTLKFIKPASLICLPKALKIDNIRLKTRGLEITLLYNGAQNQAVLIFNRSMLQEILKDSRSKDFLAKYYYPIQDDLDANLEYLKRRLQGFFQGKNEFAHEIGLFLGYPLDDVMDFIKKDKRHYFSGYWKVYNDPHRAIRIMSGYELAKAKVIKECLQGKKFFEIIKN
ncbi:MAG TPA: DUF3793 family protein [Clostridia bacterium]